VDQLLRFAVQAALGIAVPAWIIRRDEARLPPALSDRSFDNVSFWVAVVVFGPLSLPVHFVRTRRNIRGVCLGLSWFAMTLGLLLGLDGCLARLLE